MAAEEIVIRVTLGGIVGALEAACALYVVRKGVKP